AGAGRAGHQGGGGGCEGGPAGTGQRLAAAALGGQPMRLFRMGVSVVLAAGFFLSCGGAFAASAEKGKTAYMQHGCWQCHGTQAQGGVTGPKLAPEPMPIEIFTNFVRTSNRAMPPYPEAVPSNHD